MSSSCYEQYNTSSHFGDYNSPSSTNNSDNKSLIRVINMYLKRMSESELEGILETCINSNKSNNNSGDYRDSCYSQR